MKAIHLALWLAVAALAGGCRDERPPAPVASADPPPPPPPPPPIAASARNPAWDLTAAPAPSGADRAARLARTVELLEGGIARASVPEVATDPGVPRERHLEARLRRTPAPPMSALSQVRVSGPLTEAQARGTLRAVSNSFAACYEDRLAKRPTLRGDVSVEAEVAPDGHVDNVTLGESTIPDPVVVECVRRILEGLALPEHDHPSRMSATLSFAPG